ncbi:hypothetical protein TDB9533_04771 [Thalassocella blandensis]|nr:hypothetical protein TDB9533_04771 [Thalassocella blandensis]
MAVGMWVYFLLGGGELNPFIGIGVWFALMFSSVVVCNEGFLRLIKGQSDREYIDELLSNNLASMENYVASSALTFEDLSTGCLCHILDVGVGKSICLYGQYLYEYTEINDDPELNQCRKFPTSKFSLVRKKKNNEVLDMEIGTDLINEITIENVNINELHKLNIKLEDGEIISVPFNIIKEVLTKNG